MVVGHDDNLELGQVASKKQGEVQEEKGNIETSAGGADIGVVLLLRQIRMVYCATTQV